MRDSELIDWEQLEMIFGEEEEEFDEEMGDLFREFIEDGRDRLVTLKGTVFDSNRENDCPGIASLKRLFEQLWIYAGRHFAGEYRR